MLPVAAILSGICFHFIMIGGQGRSVSIIGWEMATNPLAALMGGIPLALMAGPCFGKQTGMKRRIGLLGVAALQGLCGLAILHSTEHGATFLTTIPFWACSLPLLVKRLRQNPDKEAADKEARLRDFKHRIGQIRSSLAKKSPAAENKE